MRSGKLGNEVASEKIIWEGGRSHLGIKRGKVRERRLRVKGKSLTDNTDLNMERDSSSP